MKDGRGEKINNQIMTLSMYNYGAMIHTTYSILLLPLNCLSAASFLAAGGVWSDESEEVSGEWVDYAEMITYY